MLFRSPPPSHPQPTHPHSASLLPCILSLTLTPRAWMRDCGRRMRSESSSSESLRLSRVHTSPIRVIPESYQVAFIRVTGSMRAACRIVRVCRPRQSLASGARGVDMSALSVAPRRDQVPHAGPARAHCLCRRGGSRPRRLSGPRPPPISGSTSLRVVGRAVAGWAVTRPPTCPRRRAPLRGRRSRLTGGQALPPP